MNAYNRNYYQFDIYLGCHAILAVANKSICGCILRNTENNQIGGIDVLAKDSEVGQKSQHDSDELACSHLHFCTLRGIYFDMNTKIMAGSLSSRCS